MGMLNIIICRTCGDKAEAELANNQKELADVGMLELRCRRCATPTRWGLAENYRQVDRRSADRRGGAERRRSSRASTDRRRGSIRRFERRTARKG